MERVRLNVFQKDCTVLAAKNNRSFQRAPQKPYCHQRFAIQLDQISCMPPSHLCIQKYDFYELYRVKFMIVVNEFMN